MGKGVGYLEGAFVGAGVGYFEGAPLGAWVGAGVGEAVGSEVGSAVGVDVGTGLGAGVGIVVGAFVGDGVSQIFELLMQIPLLQSEWSMHFKPDEHGGQLEEPQSTSVSVPPCRPSLQVASVGAAVGAGVG